MRVRNAGDRQQIVKGDPIDIDSGIFIAKVPHHLPTDQWGSTGHAFEFAQIGGQFLVS